VVLSTDRTVTATFDPDTMAPLIADIEVDATNDSATVTWITNEPATSRVDYGETASYGNVVEDLTLKTAHSLVITGLFPATQYEFSVTSQDVDTMASSSPNDSFTTQSGAPGAFQSDDFNQAAIDTQLWTVVDPLGDATISVSGFGTADARLSISVPADVAHDPWTSNDSARIMQPASNTDFQIEAKMESVVSQQYQSQGIIIEQDSGRWLRFDVHSDGTNVFGLAASNDSGAPTLKILEQLATGSSPTPIWLRVTRSGNQWTHEHSFDGSTWIMNGSFSSVMSVKSVGVFGGNFRAGGNPPAHTAIFDYVFNPASPIVPEDTP
jgi:regulation of enolase protein 1 (concanavalin A-like superfamily)